MVPRDLIDSQARILIPFVVCVVWDSYLFGRLLPRLLKWLVAAPFTLAALAVLSLQMGTMNDQLPTRGGSLRQD